MNAMPKQRDGVQATVNDGAPSRHVSLIRTAADVPPVTRAIVSLDKAAAGS